MKRKIYLVGCLGYFSLCCLFSFEWPVDDVVLKKTFGEVSGKSFNSGIILGGERQAVHPVDYGEIVFYQDDEGNLPSGLGRFVVVEHARNLYSIYSRLEMGEDYFRTGYSVFSREYPGMGRRFRRCTGEAAESRDC